LRLMLTLCFVFSNNRQSMYKVHFQLPLANLLNLVKKKRERERKKVNGCVYFLGGVG
jgi:hypothetical protein